MHTTCSRDIVGLYNADGSLYCTYSYDAWGNTLSVKDSIGAVSGFIIGVGIYIMTDMIEYNGKTARTWAKEGINSLW